MTDLKQRRNALGWSRATLAEKAAVDPRTVQLLELDLSEDHEARSRCEGALAAAERPAPGDAESADGSDA